MRFRGLGSKCQSRQLGFDIAVSGRSELVVREHGQIMAGQEADRRNTECDRSRPWHRSRECSSARCRVNGNLGDGPPERPMLTDLRRVGGAGEQNPRSAGPVPRRNAPRAPQRTRPVIVLWKPRLSDELGAVCGLVWVEETNRELGIVCETVHITPSPVTAAAVVCYSAGFRSRGLYLKGS